mgnify:CR=1 FL=1
MWELQEQVDQLVEKYFEDSGAVSVSADAVGLDARAGTVYVSTEERYIAVVGNTRLIDYYGGFEYIDEENRVVVGGTTFYSEDHDRVADALEYFIDLQQQDGQAYHQTNSKGTP